MSPRESEHLKRDTAHHRWCECGMCTATDANVHLCVLCTVCVVWHDMMVVVVVVVLARVSGQRDQGEWESVGNAGHMHKRYADETHRRTLYGTSSEPESHGTAKQRAYKHHNTRHTTTQ
jgi:hypothetical protein